MSKTLQARQRQSQLFQQQENSAILYSVNWASELNTDTIDTSSWTEETSGATLADETNTTNSTSVRVSGKQGRHIITNKITTTAGDTRERQLIVKILDNSSGIDLGYC